MTDIHKVLFKVNRRFNLAVHIMMAICGSYCLIFFFIYAFDCNPVHQLWTTLQPKNCILITTVTAAVGGFNIATDFILLVMPLPLIYRLQLRPRQRWGLLGIFATGVL